MVNLSRYCAPTQTHTHRRTHTQTHSHTDTDTHTQTHTHTHGRHETSQCANLWMQHSIARISISICNSYYLPLCAHAGSFHAFKGALAPVACSVQLPPSSPLWQHVCLRPSRRRKVSSSPSPSLRPAMLLSLPAVSQRLPPVMLLSLLEQCACCALEASMSVHLRACSQERTKIRSCSRCRTSSRHAFKTLAWTS